MAGKIRSNKQSKRFNLKVLRALAWRVLLYFLMVTVLWVLAYRFINPPITVLMVMRNVERKADGKAFKIEKDWVDLQDISTAIQRAAVAGEDQLFVHHAGFDMKAISRAYSSNKDGSKVRGGSTISQQTAKNVFLWPGRSWVRKGFEAYFTILIELLWGKERILEVYLNVIEMGDGIYGAEAAAQAYYGKSCTELTRAQAAMIVACFPNPLRWTPLHPTRYIRHRQYLIMQNIRRLGPLKF
ncbi:monofunctional biosynthetic peptidoglycan transglycosylase [Pedobacter sp. AW31-3R]|uniref:monofunctional biosynthetic peptidoglycan transglycosylase n=1 Tax=Pedobacter sp. AW31-3R TaxID=3445781 RepID=UPI003F9EDD69